MNKYKIETKWAFLFAIVTLAWMFLEKLLGLHSEHIDKHATYTNFFAIPAIAVYVLALLDKRNNYYSGVMTYKQGFIAGLIITVIITLLSPFTQIITSKVITPEYFPNVIEYVVRSGKMSLKEAEEYFSLSNYVFQSVIGALVMGTITTAIVALFTKTKTK